MTPEQRDAGDALQHVLGIAARIVGRTVGPDGLPEKEAIAGLLILLDGALLRVTEREWERVRK